MFKTENKLKDLFEYARFVGDPKIEKLASEAVGRYAQELSDNDLAFVSAAGDINESAADKHKPDGANE